MVPDTYTKIDDEEVIVKMQKMLDLLEDNDDVQELSLIHILGACSPK